MASKTDALVALGYIPHSRGDSEAELKFSRAAFSRLVSFLNLYKEAKKRVNDGYKIMKGVYSFDDGEDEFTFYQKDNKFKWADYRPIGGTFVKSYDATKSGLEWIESNCIENFIAFNASSERQLFNRHINFLLDKDRSLVEGLGQILISQTKPVQVDTEKGVIIDIYAMGEAIQEDKAQKYIAKQEARRDPSIKERAQETLEEVLNNGKSLVKTPIQTAKRVGTYMKTPEFRSKAAVVGATSLLVVPYLGQTLIHLLGYLGILDHEKNKESSHFDHGTAIDHHLYKEYQKFLDSSASRGSDDIPLLYANNTTTVQEGGRIYSVGSAGNDLTWVDDIPDNATGDFIIKILNGSNQELSQYLGAEGIEYHINSEGVYLTFIKTGAVFLLNKETRSVTPINKTAGTYVRPMISNGRIVYSDQISGNILENNLQGNNEKVVTKGLSRDLKGNTLLYSDSVGYKVIFNNNMIDIQSKLSQYGTISGEPVMVTETLMAVNINNSVCLFDIQTNNLHKISNGTGAQVISEYDNHTIWCDTSAHLINVYNCTDNTQREIKTTSMPRNAYMFGSEGNLQIAFDEQQNSKINVFNFTDLMNYKDTHNNTVITPNNNTTSVPQSKPVPTITITGILSLSLLAPLFRRRKIN